jgi:hypothetical protein
MLNDVNLFVETASTISCHTTMVGAALQSSSKYRKEKLFNRKYESRKS